MGLGRVFTANMTGNTVLLAVAAAEGSGTRAAHSGVALAAFAAGVALAVLNRRSHEGEGWPSRVAPAVLLGFLILLGLAIGWAVAGARPAGLSLYLLIAASALAMGIQSSVTEASGLSGISTTYMTGTLTRAIQGFTARLHPRRSDHGAATHVRAGLWLVYIVGAAAGALGERSWHAGVMAIPAALTAAVALVAVGSARGR
jgi:uncharacterized membrane protein YoaK (UPF0700 family)